ncbi:MAG: L-2-amino-thiazoline-4-carboxylic acid hydrolase [Candidatus Thorarchaeota archaeon]|nr:MAG: L-2-amino-thiazoline-4-carboxylic acid hydrolase [Candidatus Thorarchaeota archaeon]
MEFEKSGSRDPNALEHEQSIQPLDSVKRSPWKRLNYLLNVVKELQPEAVDAFARNLELRYGSLVESPTVEDSQIGLEDLIPEMTLLLKYPVLALNNLNYFLQLLELPEGTDWTNDKLEVPIRIFNRAFLVPKYNNVQVLTETIGREDGIRVYKEYVTRFVDDWVSSEPERHSTLEEMRQDWLKDDEDNPGLVRQVGTVEDGKVVVRKDNCLWADSLVDLPDTELKYLVCCYGDFTSIRVYNRSFALTMEQTVAAGDHYCDVVVHDTRIDNDLKHPSKDFFDSIGPLDE